MPDLLSYESLDLLSCEEHCGVNMSDARSQGVYTADISLVTVRYTLRLVYVKLSEC